MNIAGFGEFKLDVSEFIASTVHTGGSNYSTIVLSILQYKYSTIPTETTVGDKCRENRSSTVHSTWYYNCCTFVLINSEYTAGIAV